MKLKIDNLGAFLKNKRKTKNVTLKEIAQKIDKSIGYISRIENETSIPSLETLYMFSTILDFNIEDVCEFDTLSILEKKEVNIDDLFSFYNIRINGNLITDKKKYQFVKLLSYIEKVDWNDNLNKVNDITSLLSIVDEIKRGEIDCEKK